MSNKTKVFGLTTLALFVFLAMASGVSATVIFSDDFNDGNLNGWTVVNDPAILSGASWENTGTYAEAKPGFDGFVGTSIIERVIDTSGFESIVIKYDRRIFGGFESSDSFVASYSTDGTTFTPLEVVSNPGEDTTFVTKIFSPSGSSIDNNPNFKLRFACTTNAASEICRIDNVIVEGDAIGVSTPSLTVTQITPLTQDQNGIIRVTNTGSVPLSEVIFTQSGSFSVTFNPPAISNLAVGAHQDITVMATDLGTVGFGGKSVQITATSGSASNSVTMNVGGSFCSVGETGGDLEIRKISIYNRGAGKKEEWKLLDRIEITVEVQNVGDETIDDVIVELGFFDKNGVNQIRDFEFDNEDDEEAEIGRIRSGNRDSITFYMQVPADFEDGVYKLAIKAYSDDVGEDTQCTDTSRDFRQSNIYTEIDIEREDDEGRFIAFDNIRINPVEGTCGDRVVMTFDAYNIGDDQDQVKITLRNTELAIDKSVEIRNGMDEGDKQTISFELDIPQDAQDKFYNLILNAEYDYRSGVYKQRLDSDVIVQYRIIGCGITSGSGGNSDIAVISAKLESEEVIAGGKVTVKATIVNLKSARTMFVVDALGYQSWGILDSISPRTLDLQPGESRDVFLTFVVDDGVTGERSFEVKVEDGLGGSQLREIVLDVGSATSDRASIFDFGGDNALFLWIIGAVNVILVILIIVVAVKVARR